MKIKSEKELLYLDDAYYHETALLKVLEDTQSRLEDEDLVDFIDDEIKNHQDMQKKLLKVLEDIKDE